MISIFNQNKKSSKPKIVYLPKKAKVNTKLLKKKRAKGKINNIINNRKRIRRSSGFLTKFFLAFFVIGVIILSLYFAILFVSKLRKTTSILDIDSGTVLGIDEIPAFPFSTFIFEEQIDEEMVRNFLSKGNSAYRIPINSNFTQVNEYYDEKLPELGWSFAIEVPVGSETMKNGRYWIKGEKGLRIYSKFNDIWYETLTAKEAQEGLAERVKQETERDLLLTKEGIQELLPDFPWILQVPKEFVISYSVSEFNDLRKMGLQELGGEEKISLTPLDNYKGQGLDYFLDKYITLVNSKEEEKKCGITRTELAYTEYSRGLRGTISCSDGVHQVGVIVDPYRAVGYVLDGFPNGAPYFESVFSNIRPKENKRN